VILSADVAFRCAERARLQDKPDDDDRFITQHWHPLSAWTDEDGTWLQMRCDMFDPDSRLCTAREARPPVCRGFPWYGDGPCAGRAGELLSHCSYLADVPPGQRPPESRPLIPLTPVQR
jgi:Fe-S-cluster containining protein